MNDRTLISYTANIGGRQYPLKIKPSEKELIDQTLADIGNKVAEMKASYASKDAQDWVAMALLSLTYELNKCRNNTEALSTLPSKLEQIESALDSML